MDTDKLLSEHTGPCIHSVEWYREQAQKAEKAWCEYIDYLWDLAEKTKPLAQMRLDRMKEMQRRIVVSD